MFPNKTNSLSVYVALSFCLKLCLAYPGFLNIDGYMKRSASGDHSPRSKRQRHNRSPTIDAFDRYSHYDFSNKQIFNRSRSPSPRKEKPTNRPLPSKENYRSLCISNLPHASDPYLKDILMNKFRSFGDFNVRFSVYNNERVAYINFSDHDQAHKARHSVPRLQIDGRIVRIEPVCSSKRKSPSPPKRSYSQDSEKRREKFPHHLDHKDPADDVKSTRTLFVGNLYSEITEQELRNHFDNYGVVEDIDIKRPMKGNPGNAYAFIKYINLDMAHRAKLDMSGKEIQNHQCKIGYGKPTPTRCLWVGGVGPWLSANVLEKEFSVHGRISKLHWPQGKNFAYILYENQESAERACKNMRGACVSNSTNRLRLDFADETDISNDPYTRKRQPTMNHEDADRKKPTSPTNKLMMPLSKRSGGGGGDLSPDHLRSEKHREELKVDNARTIGELKKCLSVSWRSALVLKGISFHSDMYLVKGEKKLIDDFMKGSNADSRECKSVKITQRLQLDESKLKELQERIKEAGEENVCILVAVSTAASLTNSSEKTKPFNALVTYFLKKESAGVVFLKGIGATEAAVLHCFPPSDFACDSLSQVAFGLDKDRLKNDYMTVILIRSVLINS